MLRRLAELNVVVVGDPQHRLARLGEGRLAPGEADLGGEDLVVLRGSADCVRLDREEIDAMAEGELVFVMSSESM